MRPVNRKEVEYLGRLHVDDVGVAGVALQSQRLGTLTTARGRGGRNGT